MDPLKNVDPKIVAEIYASGYLAGFFDAVAEKEKIKKESELAEQLQSVPAN
jgi:hypothetical protein